MKKSAFTLSIRRYIILLALAFAFSCSSDDETSSITNLDTPVCLTVSTNSKNSITISWGTVSDATGYYIYRSLDKTGPYEQIGSSTSNSYTDNSLSLGTTYYYKVAAYNSSGTSSESSFISVTTVPDAPTGVVTTANSTSSITVSWEEVYGATGYRIYRSDAQTYVGTSSTTSYINNGLKVSTTYDFWVTAYNSSGESEKSQLVSTATLCAAPKMSSVTAKANSANSITINWEAVASPLGCDIDYRIYRSTTSSDSYSQVGTSSTTSYTDNGLSSNTTYYYRVIAYNKDAESSHSMAYATTQCIEPNIPTGLMRSGNTLSWNAVSGASNYMIYILYQGSWLQFASSTQTSYTNSNVSTYATIVSAFAVTAVSGACESSRSSEVN